ncbi:hypothetical protein JKP88DRAFT_333679 [Tribonema minus]|uniref:Uncharacterized protein n=1 Tax=Tribonema minus TaxID=303371 RepID=A0A836C9P8_9STRA|nr:hypothetical protein JKP88DRAFT_333679 [Tribonema minus]
MLQEAADIIGAMPADFGSFKTDVPLDAVRGLALPQRLQELSLKPLRVTDVKHTWTLQSHLLPCSLQTLDISGLRVPADLVLPEGLTVLCILHLRIDDGHSGISVPALPASLESLTIMFQSDASAPQVTMGPLPATLRYLNVHCWASLRDAVGGTVSLGGLPDALRELICTGLQARDAPLLPPGLRRLHLTDTAQALGCLPESLETLELRDHQHPLPPLPPALNDLMLSGCTAPLPLLPASLLSLDVRSTAHLLPPLPCNLRRLELTMYEHQLPDLPPVLEALTLRCCGPVFVAPHRSVRLPLSLPEQLRSLALDDYQHPLPPLPPRLQELRLDRWGRPLPPLPEGLKSLYLDRTTHAVTSLPAGLLSLSVQLGYQAGISGVLACALPPGLRLLDITECYSGTREAGGWRVQPLPPALEALPPALEALTLWLKPQAEEDRLAAPDARVLRVADLPPKLRVLQLNGLADRLPASLELLYKGKFLTGQVQRLTADDSRICVQRDAFADSRPAFVSFNSTFDRLRELELYYSTAKNASDDGPEAQLLDRNEWLTAAADIIETMPAGLHSLKTDASLGALPRLALPEQLRELDLEPLQVMMSMRSWTLQSHLLPRSLHTLKVSGLGIPPGLVLPEGLASLSISSWCVDDADPDDDADATTDDNVEDDQSEDGEGTIIPVSLPLLPPSLRSLSINFASHSSPLEVTLGPLPVMLQSLSVQCWHMEDAVGGTVSLDGLPDALRELTCEGMQARNAIVLPPGLRKLALAGCMHVLSDLPEGLETLKLKDHQHLLPHLPSTLNSLTLSGCAAPVPLLPASLRSLEVADMEHPLPPLPRELRLLKLSRCKAPVPLLPASLHSLEAEDMQHPLPPLPCELQSLKLSSDCARWTWTATSVRCMRCRRTSTLRLRTERAFIDGATHPVTSLPAGLLSLSIQPHSGYDGSSTFACALPQGLRLLAVNESLSAAFRSTFARITRCGPWRMGGHWRLPPLPPSLEVLMLWLDAAPGEEGAADAAATVLRVADVPPRLRVLQLNGVNVAAAAAPPQERLPASLELLVTGESLAGHARLLAAADDAQICDEWR